MTRYQACIAIMEHKHVTHPYVPTPAGSYIFWDGFNFRWWNGVTHSKDSICDMRPKKGYELL